MTGAEPETKRRSASLQRRLMLFAAAVLAPVLVGALASGLILVKSTARSQTLAAEIVNESDVTLTLFQGLQSARLAGSGYMEEGERDDLADFEASAVTVDRELDRPVFDGRDERSAIRAVERHWRAAVRQLYAPTPQSSSSDDAADPEDLFEGQVNDAIRGVETLVHESTTEIRHDVLTNRRLNREEALIALAALLVALGVAAYLARRQSIAMLRPIRVLNRAARAFGSGHLGHRVEVASSTELREMEDAFNRMAGALQEQHDQLERQAFTDALTDIPNRALFEDRARHALERSAATRERVAVLMIDLDD